MNKKTLIIISTIAVFLIGGSIGYSFYKAMIRSDFSVISDVSCDPETEGPCFVWVCEPDWWTECTGDPDWDIWVYKVTEKQAYDIPYCDPIAKQEGFFAYITEENECDERGLCLESDTAPCETTYCDPEVDGDLCFDETKWDGYLATLRDNLAAACANPLGDYRGAPDFCAIVEGLDASMAEEESVEDESVLPDIPGEEDTAPVEEENNEPEL